jgi:hypothetical protein
MNESIIIDKVITFTDPVQHKILFQSIMSVLSVRSAWLIRIDYLK